MSMDSDKQRLSFFIEDSSSEDPDFPATNLSRHSRDSNGWKTRVNGAFPATVILGFDNAVEIKEIQALCHEYLISSKVDVFVAEVTLEDEQKRKYPSLSELGAREDGGWRFLGFLKFRNNSESGYRARELKTAFVTVRAMYIKLEVHAPFENECNPNQQSSLIAIDLLGSTSMTFSGAPRARGFEEQRLLPSERRPLSELRGHALHSKVAAEQQQFRAEDYDSSTFKRLMEYCYFKIRAVHDEDFQSAKYFKDRIEDLKRIGVQLKALEEKKNRAVEDEDFDEAQKVKMEIESLRQEAKGGRKKPGRGYAAQGHDSRPAAAQHQQHQQQQHQHQHQQHHQHQHQQPAQGQSPTNTRRSLSLSQSQEAPPPPGTEEEEAWASPPKAKLKTVDQMIEDGDPFNTKGNLASNMRQSMDNPLAAPTAKPAVSAENFNVASLQPFARALRERMVEIIQSAEGDHPMLDGEAARVVAVKHDAAYTSLTASFGEYCSLGAFFKEQWPVRRAAVQTMAEALRDGLEIGSTTQAAAESACKFATGKACGLKDTVAAVNGATLDFLEEAIFRASGNPKGLLDAYPAVLASIIAKVMEVSTKPGIRDQATRLVRKMGRVSCALVSQQLANTNDTLGDRRGGDRKKILASFDMLTGFVVQWGGAPEAKALGVEGLFPNKVLKGLTHQNVEVRDASVRLAAAVAIHRKGEVMKALQGAKIKEAVIEQVASSIEQVREGVGAAKKEARPPPREAREPQRRPSEQKPPERRAQVNPTPTGTEYREAEAEEGEEEEGEITDCEFCQRHFPHFEVEDQLDEHHETVCPMLTECICGQIVDIRDKMEHQVPSECVKAKDELKMCPTCRERWPIAQFKGHQCNKHKKGQLRCPLCHDDIGPESDPECWITHLLREPGCPCNPRHWNGDGKHAS